MVSSLKNHRQNKQLLPGNLVNLYILEIKSNTLASYQVY